MNTTPVVAEEGNMDSEYISPMNLWLNETGTYFQLNNSPYLNASITTTSIVHILLFAPPEMIVFFMESADGALSTTVTLGNLEPSTTYYKYEDSYMNEASFVTDNSGSHTYMQDLSQMHHVFIQPRSSTVFIYEDTTLTGDIHDSVEIMANDVTLDLNGYSIIGTGTGYGVRIYARARVTVKNGAVRGFSTGIYLGRNTQECTIDTVTVASNGWYGIDVERSYGGTISDSSVSENYLGIYLYRSYDYTISDNAVTSNDWFGIGLEISVSNTISANTVSNHKLSPLPWGGGISLFPYSTSNQIYHNNFIDNTPQVGYAAGGQQWDDGAGRGNYWSDYIGEDLDGDGVGDTRVPHLGLDWYPLMQPWISEPSEACQNLIETIESWDLPQGTENCLGAKLGGAIQLLNAGNINGAIHKIGDFIAQVTNDRKDLTEDQRSYLLQWANAIINAISNP